MFHSRATLRLISYFRPLPIHFNQFSNNLRHFSVLGPNCQIKSSVKCEGTRNFSTSLTLKYFLIVSKEKLTNPIGVGRWLGYDPRDNDWHCDECEQENPNGPPNCLHCGHPHVLTPEELGQVEQLEKLPNEIFAGDS
ncbi:hypothetical protein Ddc_18410 [Ditylenchus destructor]|nr:hypothetical protein Ddc_18410 [Ditylenchus destructor]